MSKLIYNPAKIAYWEAELLAASMFGIAELEGNATLIDDLLMEEFGISADQFEVLIAALAPLCASAHSELSNNYRRGFVDPDSIHTFIVKHEVEYLNDTI